ncbi:hypothetical protein WMY93_002519 [Mugilogobius chulae]|uniref:Hexosyltransferase n=1 Tax=Mugilogobius chulae TaxID=88201 RepID=A0AAW0PVP6_9GOBI
METEWSHLYNGAERSGALSCRCVYELMTCDFLCTNVNGAPCVLWRVLTSCLSHSSCPVCAGAAQAARIRPAALMEGKLVCWASALWYLSISRPTSTYEGHMSIPIRKTVKTPKNFTFTNIRSRSLNPHSFEFLINEPKKCERVSPFLVILISTNHKEFDARQAIRETWGDESVYGDIHILTIFLLGRNTDDVLNQMVEQESQIFHDIVVENFIDSYHNLTLKTIMGMRWVATFCPKAQ